MRIEKISGANIKGRKFEHDLAPVTVFTGANAAGKTARLDALRLIMLGYVPQLGATNPATFQLSSGSEMCVRAVLQDGTPISLTWKQSGQTVKFKEESGKVIGVPPVLLDCSKEYFSLSPEKRMAYVFGSVTINTEKFSENALVARIRSIKAEEHTENHEKHLQNLVNWIVETGRDHAEAAKMGNEASFQDRITTIREELKVKVSNARAGVDRMKKSLEGLTELNVISPTENKNLEKIETELESLRRERDAILVNLPTLRDSLNKIQQKEVLEKALNNTPSVASVISETKKEIAVLENELKAIGEDNLINVQKEFDKVNQLHNSKKLELVQLQADLSRVQADMALQSTRVEERKKIMDEINSVEDASEAIIKKTKEIKQIETDLATAKSNADALNNERGVIASKLGTAKTRLEMTLATYKKAKETLDSVNSLDSCPTCKSNHEGWKSALITKNTSEAKEIGKKVDEAKAALMDIEEESQRYAKSHMDALASIQKNELKWKASTAELSSLIHQKAKREELKARYALFPEIPDKTIELQEIQFELKHLEVAVEELSIQRSESETKVKEEAKKSIAAREIRQKLKDMENSLKYAEGMESERLKIMEKIEQFKDLPDAKEIADKKSEYENRVAEIDKAISNNELAVKHSVSFKHEARRRQEAIDQLNDAKAEHEILKLAAEKVSDFQHEMLDSVFGSILKVANWIAEPILRYPLSYKDGEIGYMDKHSGFIKASTFSGSEKSLSVAAMGLALAQSSEFKFLCIDELGNFYPPDLTKLLKLMVNLVKDGVIDQFVGALPGSLPEPIKGVQVIEVK